MSSIPSVESGTSTIKNIIFNKKFIIILFVVTIFLAVAFYVYNTYIAPKIDPDYVKPAMLDIQEHGVRNASNVVKIKITQD